jgi:hypothetical protein
MPSDSTAYLSAAPYFPVTVWPMTLAEVVVKSLRVADLPSPNATGIRTKPGPGQAVHGYRE